MNKIKIIDCATLTKDIINNNRPSSYFINKLPTIEESLYDLNSFTRNRGNSLDIHIRDRCNNFDNIELSTDRIRSCSMDIDKMIDSHIHNDNITKECTSNKNKIIRGCSHIHRINDLINKNNKLKNEKFHKSINQINIDDYPTTQLKY
jgi:hypothetical protein